MVKLFIGSGKVQIYEITLASGIKLTTRNRASLEADLQSRYLCCHYELTRFPIKKYSTCNQHKDNLTNLEVSEDARKSLLETFPVQKNDTVVELGAYQGFGTLRLSEMVGDNGLVLAVEADEANYKVLKRNMENNNIKNVIPVNASIWGAEEEKTMYIAGGAGSQRRSLTQGLVPAHQTQRVQTRTVDSLLEEYDIKNVDFVTMEINLAEYPALSGMQRILEQETFRIVSAGWYSLEGQPAGYLMKEKLESCGATVFLGVKNRVYAIK